jgi:hypothetical protein
MSFVLNSREAENSPLQFVYSSGLDSAELWTAGNLLLLLLLLAESLNSIPS